MKGDNSNTTGPKTCLQCGHRIIGRIDKKFCTDDCRVRYHNELNREIKNVASTINRILSKNRKILAYFCNSGETSLPLLSVVAKGFNLNYFTHTYQVGKDTIYRFVYEHGYRIQKDRITIIAKKPDEDIALSNPDSLFRFLIPEELKMLSRE